MDTEKLGKAAQVIHYLCAHYPDVSITSLIKLSYLADLMSIKKHNCQISDFNYVRYNFGPFDKEIYTVINELIKKGKIISTQQYSSTGNEYISYATNECTDEDIPDLTKENKDILDELTEGLKGFGARALTEVTYKTGPMIALGATLGGDEHIGAPLDMTK